MKAAVFGSGTMGAGIAELFASYGHTVLLYASSIPSAQGHREKMDARLDSRVARGKLTQEKKQSIMDHILVEEKSAVQTGNRVRHQHLRAVDYGDEPWTVPPAGRNALLFPGHRHEAGGNHLRGPYAPDGL